VEVALASGECRRVGVVLASVLMVAGPLGAGPLGSGPLPSRRGSSPCPAGTIAGPTPDLSLVWVDVTGVARFAFTEAARETAALLRRMGVAATIRAGDSRSVTEGSEMTVIVLPARTPGTRLDHSVMGATSRAPEGGRAIWVYAAGVASTLGLGSRPAPGWSMGQRREFGRALGRVVAHELVHAIAPERPHVKGGLMAASMGRALLLGSEIAIDIATSEALRTALAGRPAPEAARAAMPAAGEGSVSFQ
jgi:hypothetical protein